MKDITSMSEEELLSDEVFLETLGIDDKIARQKVINSLRSQAKKYRITREFDGLLKLHEQLFNSKNNQQISELTNFSGAHFQLRCNKWIADDNGIRMQIPKPPYEVYACHHPIMPIIRLRNAETGKEKVKLAFKRNGKWAEMTIPKGIIVSAQKIIDLAEYGVSVTSENSKTLVKFLNDLENLNEDLIRLDVSTSKLGWHGKDFLPYSTNPIFDGDVEFDSLVSSIHVQGNRDSWLNHAIELRKIDRIEIKLSIAASLSSVLVKPLGSLPFVIDFWNRSGGGKTVLLKLAASIWADPSEGCFIGNYDQTQVGLEVRADLLNNLPLILDDSNNANKYVKENFDKIIYTLCSGKGKTRSNKKLSIERERSWRNCTLTNGERPLSSYMTQGGALNRVLEVPCAPEIFNDPQKTIQIVCSNFGFIGEEFVSIIKGLDESYIYEHYNEYIKQLSISEKTQKQIVALAVILTADKIATDFIFRDGEYLPIDKTLQLLLSKNEMSDDERCYKYLIDEILMNQIHFHIDDEVACSEQWGLMHQIDGVQYALIIKQAFFNLCHRGGFSDKSFLNWAQREGKILTDGNRKTKNKTINGKSHRMVWIKIDDDSSKTEASINSDEDFKTLDYYDNNLPENISYEDLPEEFSYEDFALV